MRIVTCHLGAGASLAAVARGRSVDTTMGFTPLEGLVMATRSGSVDPGLLLWLLEHGRPRPAELADALEHRSGLLGAGGHRRHARGARARRRGDEPTRALALDVYVHRLRAAIAAMAAALGGLDALVFTGGVGERAAGPRAHGGRPGLPRRRVDPDATRQRAGRRDQAAGAPCARWSSRRARIWRSRARSARPSSDRTETLAANPSFRRGTSG